MTRVALFCPVHRRPDLIRDQIASYRCAPADALHLLHPSREGGLTPSDIHAALRDQPSGVEVSLRTLPTAWNCIFGAFVALTDAFRDQIERCDAVYLHTDADLMLSGDFDAWTAQRSLACTMQPLNPANHWAAKIAADERFDRLREELGIDTAAIRGGRQEGALLPVAVWFEAVRLIGKHYEEDFYADPRARWPIEEWVLPTVVRAIAPALVATPILVRTRAITGSGGATNPRDVDENCMSDREVTQFIDEAAGGALAAKWFSQDYYNDARVAVRAARGFPPLDHT